MRYWTFQEGDEVIFDLEDMKSEWEDDEEQYPLVREHLNEMNFILYFYFYSSITALLTKRL